MPFALLAPAGRVEPSISLAPGQALYVFYSLNSHLPTRRDGQYPALMRCTECEAVPTDAACGGIGLRADDPEEADPPQLAFYCPTCAEREFGERFANRRAKPS